MITVPSINPGHNIEIVDFDLATDVEHMIGLLGRGRDCRTFVVNDIEAELYRQTPGAQLLAVRCNEKPEVVTRAIGEGSGNTVVVESMRVTFPVTARVMTSDGAIWKLDIRHSYDATNLNLPVDQRQLRLDFEISAHFHEGRTLDD